MNDNLEQKLNTLHTANQPDVAFTEQLEQQLRLAYTENPAPIAVVKENGHLRLRRRLIGLAASVILIASVFAVVPPLRTLAQNIIDFFVPSEEFIVDMDETLETGINSVETVNVAESIAHFEALEWTDENYQIFLIQAAYNYIHIVYERKNDRGPLIAITKYRTGAFPEQNTVGQDADIQNVTVRGFEGQYVAGSWLQDAGSDEPAWQSEDVRQLYWQDEDNRISYRLYMLLPEVETIEETIAIAEALQEVDDPSVEVATISEAEEIAGFDALGWIAQGYELQVIFASKDEIHTVYAKDDKPVVGLSQYRTSVRSKSKLVTIGLDTEIQSVTVRGIEGQFVKGGWEFPDNSNPVWDAEARRQLYWEEDGIGYYLRVDRTVADTMEEVIALAESLE